MLHRLVPWLPALALAAVSPAQWTNNSALNTPVSAPNDGTHQQRPRIAGDGKKGAFVLFEDARFGGVSAQHLDAQGVALWAPHGIATTSGSAHQLEHEALGTGGGEVIVAWVDTRNGDYDIYAQKLNTAGQLLWGGMGAEVVSALRNQRAIALAGDGQGGVFVAWEDDRASVAVSEIWMQHMLSNGAKDPFWPAAGLLVAPSTFGSRERKVAISPDGTGGAVLAWESRNGADDDVVGAGVLAVGVVAWTRRLTFASNGAQNDPVVAAGLTFAPGGGAVFAWESDIAGTVDIHAAVFDAAGNPVAGFPSPLPITTQPRRQVSPAIAQAGGTAYLAWYDERAGAGQWQLFAQRIRRTPNGYSLWNGGSGDGVLVTASAFVFDFTVPPLLAAAPQGPVVVWPESRGGTQVVDLYAQRLAGANGARAWAPLDGVPVATAGFTQSKPVALVYQTAFQGCNLIAAWQDLRDFGSKGSDVYAQSVRLADGSLGGPVSCAVPPMLATGIGAEPHIVLEAPSNIGVAAIEGIALSRWPGLAKSQFYCALTVRRTIASDLDVMTGVLNVTANTFVPNTDIDAHNTGLDDAGLSVSPDGLVALWQSGGSFLCAMRPAPSGPFGPPIPISGFAPGTSSAVLANVGGALHAIHVAQPTEIADAELVPSLGAVINARTLVDAASVPGVTRLLAPMPVVDGGGRMRAAVLIGAEDGAEMGIFCAGQGLDDGWGDVARVSAVGGSYRGGTLCGGTVLAIADTPVPHVVVLPLALLLPDDQTATRGTPGRALSTAVQLPLAPGEHHACIALLALSVALDPFPIALPGVTGNAAFSPPLGFAMLPMTAGANPADPAELTLPLPPLLQGTVPIQALVFEPRTLRGAFTNSAVWKF